VLGENWWFGITNLATEPSVVVDTKSSGSIAYCAVTTDGWEAEEAEMPSAEPLSGSSDDGLYYCQYEGCKRPNGYALKCQLRYVSHPS
jgi:hypothetical protein